MYPPASPTSQVGQLQSELSSIKNSLYRKADTHEISSLNSRVDALVSAVRDISTVCDGILSRVQVLEEKELNNMNSSI